MIFVADRGFLQKSAAPPLPCLLGAVGTGMAKAAPRFFAKIRCSGHKKHLKGMEKKASKTPFLLSERGFLLLIYTGDPTSISDSIITF
ncbi:hypothetical protein ACTID9_26835 [Brevibacillus fluminis]|uniref:hypothetical protein n=1 Tax=Brevibacillus fluminis TaxID=511487 RepID=UPI003F8CE017